MTADKSYQERKVGSKLEVVLTGSLVYFSSIYSSLLLPLPTPSIQSNLSSNQLTKARNGVSKTPNLNVATLRLY